MCATCRFYHPHQPTGVPPQQDGKCAHPARRSLMTMVRVRGKELACRNQYDEALWEQNPVAPLETVIASVAIAEHVEGIH